MTPGRDAFLQLVAVLLASGLLRAACAPRTPPEEALPGRGVDPSELVDSAEVLAAESERRARPLEPGERVDVNRAPEAELDRLPGVGPGLARAIVEARDTLPFRAVDELGRVRGIGGSTLERLRPMVEVGSLPPRGRPAGTGSASALRRSGARPVLPGAVGRRGTPLSGVDAPVDLNRAGPSELESLPGVGPVLAERILEARTARGRFRSVDELIEVKGVGPALLERLRERVRVGAGR